jgi:hypothetical protein
LTAAACAPERRRADDGKAAKLARIERCCDDLPCDRQAGYPDFEPRSRAVSYRRHRRRQHNDYDHHVLALINVTRMGSSPTGGAGRRAVYFDNVVNFEIVPYDTTDVRGVGEELPFRDASFVPWSTPSWNT